MTADRQADSPQPLQWDVFCRVVDNLGDIGVCWRLAVNLASRGQQVRLWVDDASALSWMAPGALEGRFPGIQVMGWEQSRQSPTLEKLLPADVWVETFGCEIAPEFIASHAYLVGAKGQNDTKKWPVWLNLEYLTAESFAERTHILPSPVMSGPAAGQTKHFFYPGFTPGTGGLLREADLPARQAAFDRAAWLSGMGIGWHGERLVSLFCYEPTALEALLRQLAGEPEAAETTRNVIATHLLVTHGRAAEAVKKAIFSIENEPQPLWNMRRQLSISYLPALTQRDFDHLLWACDLNFVRGEDSLVRAIWAGRPFVWQIYPQHDNAHHDKLAAFLDMIDAPASLRHFHRTWNEVDSQPLQAPDLTSWSDAALRTRQRLLAQPDLVSQLLEFVARVRR
jgi:uncharacterized repeat protein (TIGR03837 family)